LLLLASLLLLAFLTLLVSSQSEDLLLLMLGMLMLLLLAFPQLQMPSAIPGLANIFALALLQAFCTLCLGPSCCNSPSAINKKLWPGFLAEGCILAHAGIPAVSEVFLLLTSLLLFTILL
jgi:hypothetical protein